VRTPVKYRVNGNDKASARIVLLTPLARKLRVVSGYGNYNVPRPRCFLYEGEHLSDHQDRMAIERGTEK